MSQDSSFRDLSVIAVLGLLCWSIQDQVRNAPVSWFPGDIGVTAVPGLVNATLGLLLVLLAVRTAVQWRQATPTANDEALITLRWGHLTGVTLLYLLFIALVATTELHFTLLAGGFLAGSAWLLQGPEQQAGFRRALLSVSFGVVVAVLCQLVFGRVFGVILP